MKFNQIVKYILREQAILKETKDMDLDDIVNRLKKNTPSPSQGVLNKAEDPTLKNLKLIDAAIAVTISTSNASSRLFKLMEEMGRIDFDLKVAKKDVLHRETDVSRFRLSRNSTPAAIARFKKAVALFKKAVAQAEQLHREFQEKEPELLDKLHIILEDGCAEFVEQIQSRPETRIKSLNELEDIVIPTAEFKHIKEFLQDIFKGKTEFEPLIKFINVRKGEKRSPIFDIYTRFKNVLNTMKIRELINNPVKTLNYITGRLRKVLGIQEPTRGSQNLKKKDPSLSQVARLIEKGRYEEAKRSVMKSFLGDSEKDELKEKIDSLQRGEISEADVIRPLFGG